MAELLNEELQEVGQAVDPDSPEATSDVEEAFLETRTKQLTDSLQLLKSRLTLLKAKNELMAMNIDETSTELLPYDEISKDLNDAISLAKVQELAWETAKESFILNRDSLTEDTNVNLKQVITDMERVLTKHTQRGKTLNDLIIERTKKLKRVEEKSSELNLELQKFKHMLSVQREELNNKAPQNDAPQQRIKHLISKKLDRLQMSRMFIVNFLGVSGINFMKKPKWRDTFVNLRKQITMENLDT